MTAPGNFTIEYEISPWMKDKLGAVDRALAEKQWATIHDALVYCGAEVRVLPTPPEYCADAVFTSNAGLIFYDTFISSRFRYEERAVEESYFIEWFRTHNFKTFRNRTTAKRDTASFEGGGDSLFNSNRDSLWYGVGQRSCLVYKRLLDKFFQDQDDIVIRPVELVDARLHHLDMCFCPLDTGELLWYPPALSDHSQLIVESWHAKRLIAVDREDAMRLACNSISIGNNIITPRISGKLADTLYKRGYNVIQCDVSEFMKAGGGAKALTLEVVE